MRILIEELHQKAVAISKRYLVAEAELLDTLDQVERHRVFLAKGHPSLFQYVTRELSISESVAYNLISVMRKSREVPALKTELQAGRMTLSNARRIVPVLQRGNQHEWLTKAATLSQRELEREIVKVRPELATPERTSYVTESRVRLELGLPEEAMKNLRRIQDLLSQSRRAPISLEDALVTMAKEYLERHDPVKKAQRQIARSGGVSTGGGVTEQSPTDLNSSLVSRPVRMPGETKIAHGVRVPGEAKIATNAIREPIPTYLLHQVNLRDLHQCTYVSKDGKRCDQSRWTEIHHQKPVSEGGTNKLENLQTLCSAHHRWVHRGL